MAWCELTLTRLLLLLGLLAPLAAADANAKSEARADPRPAGSAADGLAYEPIQKTTTYTANATAAGAPPVDGWWESKICSGDYCVYTNWRVAKGRGLALVTKFDEFQKLERMEDYFNRGENKVYEEDPAPFVETEVFEKGVGLTAAKTLRRGKPLMSWSPVLVVHQALFDDVVKKKERTRLLEAAVSFLPEATRAKFDRQRARPGGNPIPRTVEEILQSQPFEIDLSFGTYRRQGADAPPPPSHSRHYANYPEAARLRHDCRPSVAHYIDESFSLRATVARRLQPGDELSITYVDPLLPRAERAEWVRRHRGYGGPCPCRACNPPGGEGDEAARKEDERLKELLEIRGELRDPDSTKVTLGMIERFLKLVEEERLHVKFAEAYELAALNFNYLGDDKRAKKYADYAVQAGIIEGGPTSNDVVAMRVMASDIKGHYSYQFTLKRRGQVPK